MLKRLVLWFKKKWFPRLLAGSAKIIIRLILRTCRFHVDGLETFTKTAKQSPCIIMLWHNRLIILAEVLNRFAPQFIYTALVSNSRDAEPLSQMALSYKAGRILRVPHNARLRALRQMITYLKTGNEVILITPDGPRGPRYVLKAGVVMAAKESEAKVIPFSWESSNYWQLNTWDHLRIPKPFSTIHVLFGDPLTVPNNNQKTLKEEVARFETALTSLT